MTKHRRTIIGILLSGMVMLGGCNIATAGEQPTTEEQSTEATATRRVTKADPEAAIKKIYSDLDITLGLVTPTEKEVTDVIGLDIDDMEEYYIRCVDPDFGANDVYIILPKEGDEHKENVLTALKNRKDARITEFANYDVYDSSAISENALIFERGGYIVMLMLADNAAARDIIEWYIPEQFDS